MNVDAIILAGGRSKRMGFDKATALLNNQPLLIHVIKRVKNLVNNIIIVFNQNQTIPNFLHDNHSIHTPIKCVRDISNIQNPNIGIYSGMVSSHAEYALILPCDTPFLKKNLLKFMLQTARNFDAVIPQWENGQIEPLIAVYKIKSALKALKNVIHKHNARIIEFINLLPHVYYLPTQKLKEIDPHLLSFYNINTPIDLKLANTLRQKKYNQNNL